MSVDDANASHQSMSNHVMPKPVGARHARPHPQVGSLTLMLLLLFGGFLLNKEAVPKYCSWISRASFFNYAYEVRVRVFVRVRCGTPRHAVGLGVATQQRQKAKRTGAGARKALLGGKAQPTMLADRGAVGGGRVRCAGGRECLLRTWKRTYAWDVRRANALCVGCCLWNLFWVAVHAQSTVQLRSAPVLGGTPGAQPSIPRLARARSPSPSSPLPRRPASQPTQQHTTLCPVRATYRRWPSTSSPTSRSTSPSPRPSTPPRCRRCASAGRACSRSSASSA